MEQLAEALQNYKDRENLSLRALAKELGVEHGTAESWLKGWRKPGYKHLPAIIERIKVDEVTIYRWLTDDTDDGKHRFHIVGFPTHSALPLAG